MNPIVQLILAAAPQIVTMIQERHAAANPSAPPLTPEQVGAAFQEAASSSLLKDAMILAAG